MVEVMVAVELVVDVGVVEDEVLLEVVVVVLQVLTGGDCRRLHP